MSVTLSVLAALSAPQSAEPRCAFPAPEVQRATAGEATDLMSRYIGQFRSPSKHFDNSDKEYFFAINYAWFDRNQSIARFKVEMVIPDDGRVIPNAEGYYGYDHASGSIYVFAAFANGITGRGEMGVFDLDNGSRSVWARSTDASGVTTYVQDMFELIDGDNFRNRTLICRSDAGEWQEVGGDVYARVEAA